MRVTVLKFTSTTTYTGKPGDVLDLPQMEAERLFATGHAESYTEPERPGRRAGGDGDAGAPRKE